MTEILVLSLNHRVTPLEARERVAFTRANGVEFLRELHGSLPVDEALLLSTCNRTELYTTAAAYDPGLAEAQRRMFEEHREFAFSESPRNFVEAFNAEAVQHLFAVAGGLESQILGESQILNQVKEARSWANAAGTAGHILSRLGDRALRVGKRIRSETLLGDGALSASTAALELARKIFGSLRGLKVLVVGSGEIAQLAVQNLEGQAVGEVLVSNRTRERAEELAVGCGGRVVDFEKLDEALVEADVVLSSTASPTPIVTAERMKRLRPKRGVRPMLIVDLAMPRDFEAAVGQIDSVFLKNLDDLQEIVEANRAHRTGELPLAKAIVIAECETFFDWLHGLEAHPTIVELRQQFEWIRDEELAAWLPQFEGVNRDVLEQFARRLVNRLLHLPSENLKRHTALRDRETRDLIHELLTQAVPHPKAPLESGDTSDSMGPSPERSSTEGRSGEGPSRNAGE